jgi:hypothetical protein
MCGRWTKVLWSGALILQIVTAAARNDLVLKMTELTELNLCSLNHLLF